MSPRVNHKPSDPSGFARQERRALGRTLVEVRICKIDLRMKAVFEKHAVDERFGEDQIELLKEGFESAKETWRSEGIPFGDYEENKFFQGLERAFDFPASGGGGAHPYCLVVANVLAYARLQPVDIELILAAFVHGDREVTDRELEEAAEKAVEDFEESNALGRFAKYVGKDSKPKRNSPEQKSSRVTDEGLEEYISRIEKTPEVPDFEDFQYASPGEIPEDPRLHGRALLESSIFQNNEFLYIDKNEHTKREQQHKYCKTKKDWLDSKYLRNRQFIVVNPVLGKAVFQGVDKKTGEEKWSYRSDDAVVRYAHCPIEIDPPSDKPALANYFSLKNQLRFWATFDLFPVVALIYSGGKSIHAWLKVENVTTREQWQTDVVGKIFKRLVPMGVDPTTKNVGRFSRFPGYRRWNEKQEKYVYQQLLWLSPGGERVRL